MTSTDRTASDLTREALTGAVLKDLERLQAAFRAVPDGAMWNQVIRLQLNVAAIALRRLYDGLPGGEQNAELAAGIAEVESWSAVLRDDVEALLETICTQQRLTLPLQRLPVTLFVTTGHLLSSWTDDLGYASWDEFLDDILVALDDTDDPSGDVRAAG
jgi:hypothetical protein